VGGKVLIVNLEFPPVGGPGVQRVLKFVRYLPEEDWVPTVICGDRSTWHDWSDDTLLKEVPKSINVCRLSFSTVQDYSSAVSTIASCILLPFSFRLKTKSQEELSRVFLTLFAYIHPEPLLSWIYFATKEASQRHRKDKFDVVVTSGPPHITHMVGFILKHLHQVKWVADFRDPWVDSLLQADRLGVSRRLDRIWERLVLRDADRVVTVSPSWSKLLARKFNNHRSKKVHVVYNGYDPEDIPDGERKARSLNASNVLHIHYNGSIQGPMSPDLFLKAIAALEREKPDTWRDLECTFTGLPEHIASRVNGFGLNPIVKDIGRLSHRESLKLSMGADVLLLILNNADDTASGHITGKVYEYVAMGKSILAIIPPRGDLYTLLKGYEQSFIVRWDDLAGIMNILELLMARKRDGQLNSVDPPKWIEEYSRQTQARQLAGILESL
jgi:hypothetical protein